MQHHLANSFVITINICFKQADIKYISYTEGDVKSTHFSLGKEQTNLVAYFETESHLTSSWETAGHLAPSWKAGAHLGLFCSLPALDMGRHSPSMKGTLEKHPDYGPATLFLIQLYAI